MTQRPAAYEDIVRHDGDHLRQPGKIEVLGGWRAPRPDGGIGVQAAPCEDATVLAAWTAKLARALDMHGFDGNGLARQAGIDPADFTERGNRLPHARTCEYWRIAVEATGDPYFGLKVARLVRPSTFAGLSMGIVTSDNLEEALARIARYQAVVINPPGHIELLEQGDRLIWVCGFPNMDPQPCYESLEAFMAGITLAARDLVGPDVAPLQVATRRPSADDPAPLEKFFRCPVVLGREDYRIEFAAADAKRQLVSRSREMALLADRMNQEYLARLAGDERLEARVRDLLARLAPHGLPTTVEVAEQMAMSPRTLQRRLKEEGTTLGQITTEVCSDVASQLLLIDGLTVEAVAGRMGFHDSSSFRRAFRRWTGHSPSEYVEMAS